MAIAFRDARTSATNTINTPSVQVDDIMVAILSSDGTDPFAAPTGWTQIQNSATGLSFGSFWKKVVSGEATSHVFSGGGGDVSNAILAYSGVDKDKPIVNSAIGAIISATTTPVTPSIDLGTATDSMVLASFTQETGSAWTAGSSMTERVDVTSGLGSGTKNSMMTQDIIQSAGGLTGQKTATSDTSGDARGLIIALRSGVTNITVNQAISLGNTNIFRVTKDIGKRLSFANTSSVLSARSLGKILGFISSHNFKRISSYGKRLNFGSNHVLSVTKAFNTIRTIFTNSTSTLTIDKGRQFLLSIIFGSNQNWILLKSIGKPLTFSSAWQIEIRKDISKLINILSPSILHFIRSYLVHRTLTVSSTASFDIKKLFTRSIFTSSVSDLGVAIKKALSVFVHINVPNGLSINRGYFRNIFFSNSQISNLSMITGRTFFRAIDIVMPTKLSIGKHISKSVDILSAHRALVNRLFNRLISISSVSNMLFKIGDSYIVFIKTASLSESSISKVGKFVKNINIASASKILDPIKLTDFMKRLINKIGV